MQICKFLGAMAIAIASVFAVAAYASAMTPDDFVHKASVAGIFEVETSKVALERSQNSDIKTFAQRMVDDHTAASEKLKSVLASSQSQIKPADMLDTKHQALLNTLKKTPDADFDSTYISMQTDAHKQAVNLFGDYSLHGSDANLKQFAADTLPTLQDHLKHVKMLKANQ